ncbi:hypothetical protein [Parahaliea mediterranea]|uniref:Uncharacterized protein n=1 Tax=Parahaliea mediterranea TaxID=651086 RepID=A0A939INS1_9GAMM|nr:hypothetical protein [Parahaliea mediterranea]MBN7798347.1 hypothetical protein [Parahaliea mediterranea]
MHPVSVSLDHARLMLGLRGQELGLVRWATLDAASGSLEELLLETRWQQIAIPWRRVEFDEQRDVFRLVSQKSTHAE